MKRSIAALVLTTSLVIAGNALAQGKLDKVVKVGSLGDQSSLYADIGGPGSVVAAQMAIVQQMTNQKIGFANPALYAVNRKIPALFRDTLPQSLRQALVFSSAGSDDQILVSLDADSSLQTQKGYDEVTGLGRASYSLLSSLATVG